MTIGNQMSNVNSYGCGTTAKCSCCVYKLICPRSPYCTIINNGNNNYETQLLALTQLIAQSFDNQNNLTTQSFENQNNIMKQSFNEQNDNNTQSLSNQSDLIKECCNKVIDSINNLSTQINELQDYIKKNCCKKNENDNSVISNDNIEPIKDIALYNAQENNDTVLVEKKNIFGKTKWVEEKRK